MYENFGFAKAVSVSEVGNTTKELELELNEVTTSNKKQSIIMKGTEPEKQHIA